MESSVGSKKSVYGMLMSVLFYTTGFICSLRIAVCAMYLLIPSISHIIALYYPSSSYPSTSFPPSTGTGGMGFAPEAGKNGWDDAGLLFKLVHTAAGHDILVPISSATAESASVSDRALTAIAVLSPLISVAIYYYFHCRSWGWWTQGKITRSITAAFQRQPRSLGLAVTSGTTTEPSSPVPALSTSRSSKTKLNPAAPAFTPSPPPALPPLYRLDPTARAFAPRACVTPPSPADSVDSAGPATPTQSPPSCAFAFAARRVGRVGTGIGKSAGAGGNAGVRVPVGVGKMRVVRPEEVVGERRAGEVFVFF